MIRSRQPRPTPRSLVRVLAVVMLAFAASAAAGAKSEIGPEAYVEMLRRTDPDAHARYVRLREARDKSLSELRRAQEHYRAGGPELRVVSLPSLRAARRKYAADELAFLDFLDERDRRTLEQYRGAIEQINATLAERARAREELRELEKE